MSKQFVIKSLAIALGLLIVSLTAYGVWRLTKEKEASLPQTQEAAVPPVGTQTQPQIEPENLPLPEERNERLEKYFQYIEEAGSLARKGKYSDVVELAKKAIELAPDEPRGYNWLAVGYAGLGDYSNATMASDTYIKIQAQFNSLTKEAILRHAGFLKKAQGLLEATEFLRTYQTRFTSEELNRYIQILSLDP